MEAAMHREEAKTGTLIKKERANFVGGGSVTLRLAERDFEKFVTVERGKYVQAYGLERYREFKRMDMRSRIHATIHSRTAPETQPNAACSDADAGMSTPQHRVMSFPATSVLAATKLKRQQSKFSETTLGRQLSAASLDTGSHADLAALDACSKKHEQCQNLLDEIDSALDDLLVDDDSITDELGGNERAQMPTPLAAREHGSGHV